MVMKRYSKILRYLWKQFVCLGIFETSLYFWGLFLLGFYFAKFWPLIFFKQLFFIKIYFRSYDTLHIFCFYKHISFSRILNFLSLKQLFLISNGLHINVL